MQAAFVGEVAWIPLTLGPHIFGLYGLMRKILPVDGLVSLTVETLFMTPFGPGLRRLPRGDARGSREQPGNLGSLGARRPGDHDTAPIFRGGRPAGCDWRRWAFSNTFSPTLQFSLAAVVFREPFSKAQIASFACIWTAIAIYTADSYRAIRQDRLALVEPFGGDP